MHSFSVLPSRFPSAFHMPLHYPIHHWLEWGLRSDQTWGKVRLSA